jgi:release factor glutamine methyltransferase
MTQPEAWTSLALVRWTTGYFARHGLLSPRLDAELLLAHVLGVRRLDLYLRFEEEIPEPARTGFRELVRRRAQDRVPVAYLTGKREFWSLSFDVTPATLIPRPETEVLVRAVVDLAPARVADVGTGCGAIAAAVASALPGCEIVALDACPLALEVARANLERLGLAERVRLVPGDGPAALPGD